MAKYFQQQAKRNNIFNTSFRFTNKRSGSVHIDIRFEKGKQQENKS